MAKKWLPVPGFIGFVTLIAGFLIQDYVLLLSKLNSITRYPVIFNFRVGSGTWKKVRDGSGTGIPSDPGWRWPRSPKSQRPAASSPSSGRTPSGTRDTPWTGAVGDTWSHEEQIITISPSVTINPFKNYAHEKVQLILPVRNQKPPTFKVVIEW